jgi:hypothetical protein
MKHKEEALGLDSNYRPFGSLPKDRRHKAQRVNLFALKLALDGSVLFQDLIILRKSRALANSGQEVRTACWFAAFCNLKSVIADR